MFELTGLQRLTKGEAARIAGVEGSHSSSKRLADFGFREGVQVTMVRPGATCIVRIDGRCLGLGTEHQASVRLSTETC